MQAQMRMRLFEWEHIDDYKNILYIDTDVLIDGNVSKVFDVLEKDVVYGLQEGTTASEYFGRSLFPNRRKDWLYHTELQHFPRVSWFFIIHLLLKNFL